MKFTINKNDILDILSNVQGITGRKSNLAITSNLLIGTTESGISMAATDLETGFEGIYPAHVESAGTIALNARKIFEIVRDFPSDEILFNEVENRWIEIGSHGIEYHIVGMNPEDFPEIPVVEDVEFFEVDSVDFKKAIEKMLVIGAAGDEKRAHILGVNFERLDNDGTKIIRLASTDGRRLSKVDYIYDDNMELPMGDSVIIPKRGLSDINKFLIPEGFVQIGVRDNHFILKKENETLIITLLEGEFPDFAEILDKDEEAAIELDRRLFMMMLRRMSILSSEDYRSVIFNFSDGKLLVSATNPDIGESREDMDISFSRDSIEVAFNPKYFIDTLNSISDEKVILNIKDGENPCLIEGAVDKSYLSVIMPMKI